jgi:UDP-N-acetylmuramate--alanine ligase
MLQTVRRIHLIGIGGIGVSAVARLLSAQGYDVRGSDVRESSITRALRAEGIDVRIGHSEAHLDGVDLVVVSTAIPATNPELRAARERGVEVRHRGELLGQWVDGAESVGVIGTHGKGTVTSLITWVLTQAGRDPGFYIGAICRNLGVNARLGTGPRVAEIDESDGSLLHSHPNWVVINNLELDHLHYYPSWEVLSSTIQSFLSNNDRLTAVVANASDAGVARLLSELGPPPFRLVLFGDAHSEATYRASDVVVQGVSSRFTVWEGSTPLGEVELPLPGVYNTHNALAAIALTRSLGLDFAEIQRGLATFRGLENRFTVVQAGGITVVKDYISHPTGIARVVEAARAMTDGPIWGVFKPYRFTMMRYLESEYRECFRGLQHLVVTRMYTAGEVPIPGVDTGSLCQSIAQAGVQVTYVEEMEDVPSFLAERVRPGETILFFGGDDLFQLADAFAASAPGGFMNEVRCPECGHPVVLPENVEEGEIVDCANCGAELDVVSLDPLEVMLYDEEEK